MIQLTLKEFLDSHLGRGDLLGLDGFFTHDNKTWDCRPISEDIAKQILAETGNLHTCYVQHADKYSPHLKSPVVWEWGAWQSQVDKWNRQAERARIEREERFIFEENARRLAKGLMKMTGLDAERAQDSARKMLKEDNWEQVCKAFGVMNPVKKVEEI